MPYYVVTQYFEKAMHSKHSRETTNKSMPREFHVMLEETVDSDVAEVADPGDGSRTPTEEPPAPKTEGLDPHTEAEQRTEPPPRNSYRISCERHPYTFGHAMFGVSDGESDDDGQDNEPPKPRSTPKRAEPSDASSRPQKKPKQ